jgi:hypothetical protein
MQVVSTLATSEAQPRRKSPRNQLGDLAQRIHAEHQEVVAATKSGVEHAMAAGDLLIKAKGQLGHGQWAEWLKRHCEISERTARLYMQLAQNRGAIAKRQRVADLTLREAAKAVAAPKAKNTSPPAVQLVNDEPKKRSTRHELMAVWLNTSAEDRLLFMNDVGLVFYRDAKVNGVRQPCAIVPDGTIPDDLSIPECLRRVS